jgi:hypothetical protein
VDAYAADAFLREHDVAAERREIVWDAIALHTSVGIASRKRPEIALVHIGAGVDVLGIELDKLPANLVAQTLEALPRHDFKTAFVAELMATVAQAPQTAPMTFLSETSSELILGCVCPSFHHLVHAAPFAE